jgi:hypothetical protein
LYVIKILFGIVIGEHVFGEQMSLGSKCRWRANVIGEQLSREQLSGEQDSGYHNMIVSIDILHIDSENCLHKLQVKEAEVVGTRVLI